MAAYVIGIVRIQDPERYMQEYVPLSGPSVEQYGGRFLARGGAHEVLEGELGADRVVIIEFDDVESAQRWWSSPEYEAAKAKRRGASEANFFLVEGVSKLG